MSKENRQKNIFPKNWELQKLSSVVAINSGISLPKIFINGYNNGEIEFFKVAQMNNDEKFMIGSEIYFNSEVSKKNKIKIFPKGSVLIPKRGGAISTNKKRILLKEASYDSNIMGLKANNEILSDDFLYIFLLSVDLRNFLDESTIPQINNKHINRIEIPLPPLPEQQRIIQKIDSLFEHLDKAIALTEKNLEHCRHLLAAALNEVFENLKDKCNWVELEELTEIVTKGSSPKWQGVNYVDSGVLFITSENVGAYRLILDSRKYVEWKFNEIEPRSILEKGDILMNIVGASIGRTAIFNLEEIANINQAVCLIRIDEKKINRDYILHFFNSPLCISYMVDKKVDNARANLSMGNIKMFLIPVPNLPTQQQIVTYLNQLSAKQQMLQQHYTKQLQHLQALKSSLLDAAFKGEL